MQIDQQPPPSPVIDAPHFPPPEYRWMIYGANGFTGELLARRAVTAGARPVLAGRNAEALEQLARELQLPHIVFDLAAAAEVVHAFADVEAVVHCAGPFAHTSRMMIDACCATSTHYVDITGEFGVIEAALQRDTDARSAGIAILPACGWDVVPSDCLIASVAHHVPAPQTIELVMRTRGRMSRGTARTVAESIGAPAMCREDGVFRPVPPAKRTIAADLPYGPARAAAISWGDIASAAYSTPATSVYTYAVMPRAAMVGMNVLARGSRVASFRRLLRAGATRIANHAPGPDAEMRAHARCELWARVTSTNGASAVGAMTTPDGYVLTVDSALRVVGLLQSGRIAPGAATPSQAFGADFAASLPGVEMGGIHACNA